MYDNGCVVPLSECASTSLGKAPFECRRDQMFIMKHYRTKVAFMDFGKMRIMAASCIPVVVIDEAMARVLLSR